MTSIILIPALRNSVRRFCARGNLRLMFRSGPLVQRPEGDRSRARALGIRRRPSPASVDATFRTERRPTQAGAFRDAKRRGRELGLPSRSEQCPQCSMSGPV